MNETYIQTIRGGIQHVIHLAKDHWTQTPKPCGFYYHHELYGYIRVSKLSDLIRDDWNETYMNWEEYAWVCYENRWLTIEQMAEKMLECGSYSGFTEALYKTVKMKYGTESHPTVAMAFIDGTEYKTLWTSKGAIKMEREKVTISIDMVRDMIREIDIRLIPQLHDLDDYSVRQGIYRIGDYGYVAEEIFDKAFDDYMEGYEADWAKTVYILEANQPEHLEFFVQAYNYGGLELLEHLLSLQFENDDADAVYYTTGSGC